MRGRMSFVGALARGLLVFTTMTASLAIALFFAITGPPSADEMAGLRIVADSALHKFEDGARQMGAAVCTQLPHKWQVVAECVNDDIQVAQAKRVASPAPVSAPLPPPPPTQPLGASPPQQDRLLGATTASVATRVPVVLEAVHVDASAQRHARTRPRVRTSRAIVRRSIRQATTTHEQHARALRRRHAPHLSPAATSSTSRPTHARNTPAVAVSRAPSRAPPVVATPHLQFAAPEPSPTQAPVSAAPDETDEAMEALPDDEQLQKQDPNQARTF